jgi:5'-3' exonuclease
MTPLIVIDVSNLCHRAWHALAGRGDMPSSPKDVIYSFLLTLGRLQRNFATDRFAFCFDHTVSERRKIFPEYKQKRKELAIAEARQRGILNEQIRALGKVHLPALGFSNIFRARGMESDDLMAAIARSRKQDEIILVTSDNDMLQCLRKNVSIYSPSTRKLITPDTFMETYGIYPKQWADVKSMAGCQTDGVPGLLGVGELSALKYLRGELKKTAPQYYWITCEKGQKQIEGCLRLVKLPFVGCPVPEITEDTGIKWARMGKMRL